MNGVKALRVPLPSAFSPQLVRGKWQKPKMSKRKIADFKKQAYRNNLVKYGASFENGEWDPRWENFGKPTVLRVPKGKKHTRTRADRMLNVKLSLEQMDDKLKALRKPKRAPEPFLTKMLKKHGILEKEK